MILFIFAIDLVRRVDIIKKRYAYLEIWECRSFQKATSGHNGFRVCYAWTAVP